MNAREPEADASFDWLRRAHRSERAPDALRRRLQERGRGARSGSEPQASRRGGRSRGSLLVLAAATALGLWVAVARPALDGAPGTPAALHDAVAPTAEPGRPGAPTPACLTPLPTSPWRQDETSSPAMGLDAVSLETQTACGPLTRRYLVRPGVALAADPPMLIVLHDGGQSAEQAQMLTRWWFDEIAERKPVVLVYANGAPPTAPADVRWAHAGVWQTDAAAHPAVDDSAYLDAIVADVRARHGFTQGEVFLAGYGSGAAMALTAALRHVDRYAGVAAFLPSRAPLPVDISARIGEPGKYPLRSIFVAQRRSADENPSNIPFEWAAMFGTEPGPVRVTRQKPGVRRIDSMLRGGVELRVVSLPDQVDPFPDPGGGDRLARAESERRPFFFDGPGAAWEFFQGAKP